MCVLGRLEKMLCDRGKLVIPLWSFSMLRKIIQNLEITQKIIEFPLSVILEHHLISLAEGHLILSWVIAFLTYCLLLTKSPDFVKLDLNL